jgi:hypothetical protein
LPKGIIKPDKADKWHISAHCLSCII